MEPITDFRMFDGSRPFCEEDAQRFLSQAYAMTQLLRVAIEDGESVTQHRECYDRANCPKDWPSKVYGEVPESAIEEMTRASRELAIGGIRTLIALGAHIAETEADALRAEIRSLKKGNAA
ncbi:hypothetical protein KFK14_17570 [Sphingobium phenoxybenzoativorans]|uniref:Uncharacterized protein n=1 Tax=Sphingobium phenoxybenzoativorans TaxID=1592790 RepID=A0A975Q0P5_9SPHN|nr:hypothetical protein [Sphingobium phenoxybenzoativorans]QUT04826.1 hypothetical protein KFK14_17570 [Sphingobium phenoxybenzoativorans]